MQSIENTGWQAVGGRGTQNPLSPVLVYPLMQTPDLREFLGLSSTPRHGELLWFRLNMRWMLAAHGLVKWFLSRTRDGGSSREVASAQVARARGAQLGWCPIFMGPNAGVFPCVS